MRAKDRFEKGQRVQLSEVGLEHLQREQRFGVVVGFSPRRDYVVRVKHDNLTAIHNYNERVIDPISRGTGAPPR